jgi:hypothetical protein
MNRCLKIYFKLTDRRKRFMATLILLLFAEEKHNCSLFTAKRNITEWSALAPTAHVVVRNF